MSGKLNSTVLPEQARVMNIQWDCDNGEEKDLPLYVIIPEEYLTEEKIDENSFSERISDWLTEKYGFCHKGFDLIFLTNNDLIKEETKLKKAVYDAGVNAIEDFLGHPLNDDAIDIWSEMDDVLSNIPDEEYLQYVEMYCK